jgi:hypothetical protein
VGYVFTAFYALVIVLSILIPLLFIGSTGHYYGS